MLKLTQHLLTVPNAMSELEALGITGKRHPQFPNLVQFRYSQIDSPSAHPLVVESRGVILDEADGWNPVALPFFRFFNLGDFNAAPIDWTTARMTEKLDGSLIILYWHKGWQVATSGTPDASGDVYGFGTTFAQLFWKVFTAQGMSLADLDDPNDQNYTFLFELTTPYNRIVVPHKDSKVTLIGMRNRNNGKEIPAAFGPKGWRYVEAKPVNSEEEVLATFAQMNAIDQEGWVVTDQNFNRVKVKHPQYVVLHHMRGEGNPSPKKALEVILGGEHEEVLTYWPEWRPLFQDVNTRLEDLENHLRETYARIGAIQSQKEFALEANKSRCSSALFMYRAGKTPTFRAFLVKMRVENLVSILDLKEIAPDIVVEAA